MNHHYKQRYDNFIKRIRSIEPRNLSGYTETHHIQPKCLHGLDSTDNLIVLSLREHYLAHWLLWRAYPNYLALASAFLQMDCKNPKTDKGFQGRITSRTYEQLKTQTYKMLGEFMTDKVHIKDGSGNILVMSKEEYANQDEHKFHTTGKIYVLDRETEKWVYILSSDYQSNKDRYITRLSGKIYALEAKFKFLDTVTNKILDIKKSDAKSKNKEYGYKRLVNVQKKTVGCVDSFGNLYYVPLSEYQTGNHIFKNLGKISVTELSTGNTMSITQAEYYDNRKNYTTSTKGKVLAKDSAGNHKLVTTAEFNTGNYVGQTAGLTTVFDKNSNAFVQITQYEFNANREKYQGPCSGKVNVIDKITGIRGQVNKDDFDKSRYSSLGNIKYLFLCKNRLTNKEKNVNIYEWDLVKDQYIIIDHIKFEQALLNK